MNDLPLTIRDRAALEIATPEVRGQERIEQTPLRLTSPILGRSASRAARSSSKSRVPIHFRQPRLIVRCPVRITKVAPDAVGTEERQRLVIAQRRFDTRKIVRPVVPIRHEPGQC